MVTMRVYYDGVTAILEMGNSYNGHCFELNLGEVDELIGILQDLSKTMCDEGECEV